MWPDAVALEQTLSAAWLGAEPAPCPLQTLPQAVLLPQMCEGGLGRQKREFIQLGSSEA